MEYLHFSPKDLLEKLEFDKVLELTQEYCAGELAAQAVADLQIMTNRSDIEDRLLEVEQMHKTYQEGHHFPQAAYIDLSGEYQKLNIDGYTLALEVFQALRQQLLLMQQTFVFFGHGKKRDIVALYPQLYSKIAHIEFAEILPIAIAKVLDQDGNMRPDASPELQRLHRLRSSKQQELDKRFKSTAQMYNGKGWLADIVESFRNGRRVLAVSAEHKRQIRGIIHDESASGRTAFIEPEEVIELNNDIFNIEQDEKREIYRILRELSALFHPFAATLQLYQQIIVEFDVIQAKARLAYQYNGHKPMLQDAPCFKIQSAFHPLLLMKNKRNKQKTVAFDLEFRGENRILILSGPNAGGKSICMKAVGLMQLMMQAGFLLPIEEGSEMGVFDKIFGDIGDQQSLEDELSTYSSRLKNAEHFLRHADDKTLVLIDEFGTGTDPKMGGAIAEAILKRLNAAKVWGVVTTHYSNLKHFANKNKGIVNAAMIFNKETLSPTYQMRIGKPGSSYAFEIATKSGLPQDVIDYARQQVGQETHDLDGILIEVQQERIELQAAKEQLKAQQHSLDQLIKNYEYAARELEFNRKKLRLQNKEQELQEVKQAHRAALKELQKAVEDIRKADDKKQAAEMAKSLIAQTKQEKQSISNTVESIKEDIFKTYESTTLLKEIGVGSHVKLRDGVSVGIVREIKRKEALVDVGKISLTVPLRHLQPIAPPIQTNDRLGIRTDTVQRHAHFEPRLDIRGMRHEEAMEILQEFVDKALLANTNQELRIIHGKATGILRRAVIDKLRKYPTIKRIYHPEDKEGGDGVTLVEF